MTTLERINNILDEYNDYVLNLSILPPEDQLDEEVALHLVQELKGEFIFLALRWKQFKRDVQYTLPIMPVLSPDAEGNMRPDWDENLPL